MNEQEKLARIISVAVKKGFDLELFKSVYKIPVMNNFQLADFLIMTELYKLLFYDRGFMKDSLFKDVSVPQAAQCEIDGKISAGLFYARAAIAHEFMKYKGSIDYLFSVINNEEGKNADPS